MRFALWRRVDCKITQYRLQSAASDSPRFECNQGNGADKYEMYISTWFFENMSASKTGYLPMATQAIMH